MRADEKLQGQDLTRRSHRFSGFWGRVRAAIAEVVDQTSFADLINENQGLGITYIAAWMI